MSVQKKLIEDILSSYDTILLHKNFIKESATFVELGNTGYSNVTHDNDGTQNDSVNKALLDDIQTAAKSVGIVATITTAKTGHNRTVKGSNNVSRHMNGTGVDVAILNGIGADGATNANNGNAEFRELGNKLKNALVSMGYNLNAEGSANPKAVLWQTNTGGNHFNHLHISNTTGVSSGEPTTSGNTSTTSSTTTDVSGEEETNKPLNSGGGAGAFARRIGSQILNVMGIKESFDPSSFGNNVQSNKGKILIPKKSNSKIKSPVSGVIVDISTNKSCINQRVIEFNGGYLEYCGITNPTHKTGDKVRINDSLGTTNSNVTVSLYSKRKDKTNIELNDKEKSANLKPKNRDSLLVKGYHNLKKSSKEKEPEKKSDNGDKSNYLLVRGYQKLKKSFDSPKKLEENIERIKGLIK